MNRLFGPIHDTKLVETIAARVRRVVTRNAGGQLQLTCAKARLAIPAEGSSHLNADDEKRFEIAFANSQKLFALPLEDLGDFPANFEMDVSAASFHAFNDSSCSHFNYVICNEELSELIVCSTDDFFVAIGSPTFVEAALGRAPVDAFLDFEKYANEFQSTFVLHKLLLSVLIALRDEVPRTPDGEVVTFPK